MTQHLSRRLTEFICADRDAAITEAVRDAACRTILDTVAVTLAGGRDDAVRRLEDSLDPHPGQQGACSPWTGRRYPAADAALLYGMASHMLDYDDVSMLAVCHASAPVLSALMAVQAAVPQAPTSGREFLAAYAVGTEVLIRLGQAMGFRHYALGFHATSTLGAVGAAAAVARLKRLDRARTGHALAIAASMAGGLRKNFGSMVKPLHVGLAAASGVRSVRIAQAGIEGADEAFESGGYLYAFSGGQTDQFPSSVIHLGEPFAVAEPGFEQKRYPCCYMLHKTIEAVLWLRSRHGCTLEQLERARVRMPIGGSKPLIHPDPRTGLNGKFSAPYAVLAALADGRIDLASFTDQAVLRGDIQSRLHRVSVSEEETEAPPGADLGRMPVTVSLTLRDGTVLEHTVIASPGSVQDPITLDQLRAKWADCVEAGLPKAPPGSLVACFDAGLELDSMERVTPWLTRILCQ